MTTRKSKSKSKSKNDDGETVSYYYRRKLDREIEQELCSEDYLDEHSNWKYYINGEEIY